jgi:hypothetical protein
MTFDPDALTAKIREMWSLHTYTMGQLAETIGCTCTEVYDVVVYKRIRPETTEWAERLRGSL